MQDFSCRTLVRRAIQVALGTTLAAAAGQANAQVGINVTTCALSAIEVTVDATLDILAVPPAIALTGDAELCDNSVGTDQIIDGSVQAIDLADGAVGSTQIADGAVQTVDLAPQAVTTDILADLSVTTVKLADLAVTSDKLADLAVTTGKIADLAVTTDKIADSAVTTQKLADLSVVTEKLANLSVTTEKLANASVTTEKIADGAVTLEKLGSDVRARLEGLDDDVETAVSGTSLALAISNVPQLSGDRNFSFGVGLGAYGGEIGYAFGASARFTPSVVGRASIGGTGKGHVGGGGGLAFQF